MSTHRVSSAAVSRSTVLPLALLVAYGSSFAGAALGRGLLVFDDHPGQLYRLWHVLTLGPVPWRWNPGWWAGYPELQFYPPGFFYVGAVLHTLALGLLTPETLYQVLLWITYLLPGLATYWLLTRVLGDGWLALPGAFLAMTLSAGTRSGVEEGLRWGLAAARLGWGLLPLLAVALLPSPRDGAGRAGLAALTLAAVTITHPTHAPLAFSMVGLAGALLSMPPRRLLTIGAGALGLSAFWLLPTVAHRSMMLPLAWGDASLRALAGRLVEYPVLGLLVAASVGGWLLHARRPLDRPLLWLLSLGPAALVIVLLDRLVAAPLGFRWLPADRLADGLVLALILGASIALAAAGRALPGTPSWALAGLAIAAFVALALGRPEPGLTLWPRSAQWPTYSDVVRGARLDHLWAALREGPAGRVLFVRSSVPLEYRPEWWRAHSHVTALTPIRSGREIVNGTFTHPSPVAGFVYKGSPAVTPITLLAEQRDGLTLFGQRLEAIRPAQFDRIAAPLRISAVVALDEDAGRLGFVAEHPDWRPPRMIGPFLVFMARAPRPLPEAVSPERYRAITPDAPGWWSPGFAYSPLWSARSSDGPLPTRRGAIGLLEVDAGGRAGVAVELAYGPGVTEWIGVALSAVSAVLLVVTSRRRQRAVADAREGDWPLSSAS